VAKKNWVTTKSRISQYPTDYADVRGRGEITFLPILLSKEARESLKGLCTDGALLYQLEQFEQQKVSFGTNADVRIELPVAVQEILYQLNSMNEIDYYFWRWVRWEPIQPVPPIPFQEATEKIQPLQQDNAVMWRIMPYSEVWQLNPLPAPLIGMSQPDDEEELKKTCLVIDLPSPNSGENDTTTIWSPVFTYSDSDWIAAGGDGIDYTIGYKDTPVGSIGYPLAGRTFSFEGMTVPLDPILGELAPFGYTPSVRFFTEQGTQSDYPVNSYHPFFIRHFQGSGKWPDDNFLPDMLRSAFNGDSLLAVVSAAQNWYDPLREPVKGLQKNIEHIRLRSYPPPTPPTVPNSPIPIPDRNPSRPVPPTLPPADDEAGDIPVIDLIGQAVGSSPAGIILPFLFDLGQGIWQGMTDNYNWG